MVNQFFFLVLALGALLLSGFGSSASFCDSWTPSRPIRVSYTQNHPPVLGNMENEGKEEALGEVLFFLS